MISLSVISAVVGALWFLGSSSGQRDRFSTLQIVPEDVVFYMAINTEPSSAQWIAVNDVLDTLNVKAPLLEALDEALAEVDLEWERDILPLAGDEAYFALTDIEGLEQGRGWVMAFHIRDPQRAEEIFLDLATKAEEEEWRTLLEEEYEGETIYHLESDVDDFDSDFGATTVGEGSVAFVGDVFVIGYSRDDVKQVIDVIHGRAPSAEGNERLQELRARQEDEFLFWGYFDLAETWDAFEELIETEGSVPDFDVEQSLEEARANADRLSFSVSARRNGLVLDSFVYRDPEAEPAETSGFATAFDSRYAKMVQADTLVFMAGYDPFNAVYLPFRDAIAETKLEPEHGQTVEETIDEFEQEIGFDFEDDLISLMTGEFAFALNASDLDSDEPEIDLLALFDVTDPGTIEETMNRFGDYFEQQELLITEQSEREGVYRWAEHRGSEKAAAWAVTKESLIVGYPASSVEDFLAGVSQSLADSPDWKRTMDLLPDGKTFVGYVSLSRLLEEIRETGDTGQQFVEATEGEVTFDDLMRIRSLGIATTLVDNGSGFHMVILIED